MLIAKQLIMYKLLFRYYEAYRYRLIIYICLFFSIEYCTFFIILFNHHRLSGMIFCTTDKYPTTIYFELICGIIYLFSNFLFLALLGNQHKNQQQRSNGFYPISISILLSYFCFLPYIPEIKWLRILIFSCVLGVFIVLNAKEKIYLFKILLSIIGNKMNYYWFSNTFFILLGGSLFIANLIHKLAGSLETAQEKIVFSFPPILFINLILCCIFIKATPRLSKYSRQKAIAAAASFKEQLGEQVIKLIVNMIIGAFLIEWYFHTPALLKLYSNWQNSSIDNLLIISNLIAILFIFMGRKYFNLVNNRIVLQSSLVIFIFLDLIIDSTSINGYLIAFLFILVTISFNVIINSVNRVVHYRITFIPLNLLMIICGSNLGIIFFCFIFSALNTLLINQEPLQSQNIVTDLILGGITILTLFYIRKLPKNS